MSKQIVRTDAAPGPFQGAPYSQAVAAAGLVYVSGQLGLKPGAKEMVPGGITEQTEQVMTNLKAILEAAGSSLEQLVKTTVYLQHLEDFAAMNEVYARQFAQPFPARTTVGVASLPLGARIEIELVARRRPA